MKWAVLGGHIYEVWGNLMGGVLYDTKLEALRRVQADQKERIALLEDAERATAHAIAELTMEAE